MPQVTVYIRKEDLPLWKAIEHKSRLLHDALRSVDPAKYNRAVEERKELEKILKPYTDVMKQADTDKDYNFCKHNNVKGFCKHGCK